MNEDLTPQKLLLIRSVVKKYLTKEANERLSRVRLVKPKLALEIELNLFNLIQQGRIKEPITDKLMKSILEAMSSGKKFRLIR